jgi:glycerol-3-phosphate dehydrogenase
MAEKVADYVCKFLGTHVSCITSNTPLPGGERKVSLDEFKRELNVDSAAAYEMTTKWGTFYSEFQQVCTNCLSDFATPDEPKTICECERVTEPELQWVRYNLGVVKLDDYRRRTRQGMGPCQGQFCYFKIANMEAKETKKTHGQLIEELRDALHKRWKTESVGDEMLKRQIKMAKYMYLLGGNLE